MHLGFLARLRCKLPCSVRSGMGIYFCGPDLRRHRTFRPWRSASRKTEFFFLRIRRGGRHLRPLLDRERPPVPCLTRSGRPNHDGTAESSFPLARTSPALAPLRNIPDACSLPSSCTADLLLRQHHRPRSPSENVRAAAAPGQEAQGHQARPHRLPDLPREAQEVRREHAPQVRELCAPQPRVRP